MSLQWHLSKTIPDDTRQMGQILFRESNVYRQMGERLSELFPGDEIFAHMYDSEGRGAEPPQLMALVTVFQMLEKVPDRLAAECVVSRMDWKYALHLPLGYAGFHFTDLMAFRQRLLAHGEERLLFDSFLKRLKDLGLIKARGKIRTDSTHVLAVVERLGRMELVSESVRVAVEAVQAFDPAWAEQQLPGAFLESYAERQSEYGLSGAQVQAKLIRAGKDGFWLLQTIDQHGSASLQHLPEVDILRQVLEQQFPGGADSPPPAKRPTGKQVIESPHEPEARFGKKRDTKWDGYKAQASETCEDDLPPLIVDLEPGGGAEHDNPALPEIQQRLAERGIVPDEQYVDQGYLSGERLVESQKAGITLMGKPLADTHPQAAFRQGQFQIDEAAHSAICPAGQTNTRWRETHQSEWPDNRVVIGFSGAVCRACEFFNQCTVNPTGRSLELHPFRKALAQRRLEAQQADFQEKLHIRAGIEATISELVRGYGLRRCRYRGKAKLGLQTHFTAIAINLKRLARWWARQIPAEAVEMAA